MSTSTSLGPYLTDEIRQRIERCPKLASLQSINRKLARLVNSEQSYNAQIAEIIRSDPSLTARLLRMVNSVYFGLSAKVNNIEEAVLYLGLRQIRELSMATPVIEDMEKIGPTATHLPWKEMWQHSIGTAIMTREILSTTNLMVDDDTDYIIGLLHNVGKVVLATAWAPEFSQLVGTDHANPAAVCAAERDLIGWDHAEIGAYYLERHQLAPEIVHAVRYHERPEVAGEHQVYAAAVQVADMVVRETGLRSGFENLTHRGTGAWMNSTGWNILFDANTREADHAKATIEHMMARLPSMLSGIV